MSASYKFTDNQMQIPLNIILTQSDITEAVIDFIEKKTKHRPQSIGAVCISQSGKQALAEQLDHPEQDIIWIDTAKFKIGGKS